MKSHYQFIVKAVDNKRYNNTKQLGNVELITSTSKEDHKASNRQAIALSTPLGYSGDIVKGDILLVHHNVFKYYYDMKGREQSGKSFFKDEIFLIDYDQFFLYKHHNEWRTHDKYCFVKPILSKDSYLAKNELEEPLHGILKYSNTQLEKLGAKEGDKVIFTPESQYEFYVDVEKLYRMFTNNIVLIL